MMFRTLQMIEVGLMKKWTDQYQPKPYQCLGSNKKEKSGPPPRLSLQNLSGAFLILLFGSIVSIVLLVCEQLVKYFIGLVN